ncbi:hypothetical protein ACTA71_006739 [Dictyostelium dimigraforme]
MKIVLSLIIFSIFFVFLGESLTYVSPKYDGCNFIYNYKEPNGYNELICDDQSVYKYSTSDNWTNIAHFNSPLTNDQYLFLYNGVNGNYDIMQVKTGLVKSSDFIQPNCQSIILENDYFLKLSCILSPNDDNDILTSRVNYEIDINKGLILNK